MTARQELASWFAPTAVQVHAIPVVGKDSPSNSQLPLPRADGKPVILALLRHCGCPFAEKTFLQLGQLAAQNPTLHCIAVSHSDQASTDRWISSVGGSDKVQIVVDEGRTLYALYGLGVSTWWHVLNPWSLANVFQLGRTENIWNRPTESGSRWQTAGLFAVDGDGIVRYAHPAQTTDDLGDLQAALESLNIGSKT